MVCSLHQLDLTRPPGLVEPRVEPGVVNDPENIGGRLDNQRAVLQVQHHAVVNPHSLSPLLPRHRAREAFLRRDKVVMIVLAEINLHPINLRLRLGHALLEIKIRKERGLSVGCRGMITRDSTLFPPSSLEVAARAESAGVV